MVNYKEALFLTEYAKEVKGMNGRIGQQLGNYRLIHRLGSGGFAEVYLGEHVYLKTQAAIKVLPMQLTSDEIENFSKALAKDPKQRFATIHEFALALEEACQRENSENRTLQLVSAGHAAIPLAAATSLVERERTPPMVATPPQDSSVIWNVPYRRNPFFTGRENILASLHEKLHAGKAMSQIQAIREKAFGSEHPDVAQTLNDLARLYSNRRCYDAAEPLFRRALAIRKKMLGSEHLEVGATKKSFSLVLWAIGKRVEATACIKHVKQIQAKYAYIDILSDI